MVFASPTFVLAFLPVMLALHALWPRRFRNLLLLAGSLLFYAWGEVDAFLLLVGATVVNFVLARHMAGRARRLALGIVVNLLPLLWFKYAAFFAGMADLSLTSPSLPLGISFYTFQAISFLVDVYRRPELGRHGIVDLALYTTFFPGMIAGPIERYSDIEPQLGARAAGLDDVHAGLSLFVRGLARKLLLANVLAVPADDFFSLAPTQMTTTHAWLALACYAAQIYHDFGGYSDMALGLARMFGFRYPVNFNRPYVATSITSFWRRWHISLSTWFRDYLYVPLGGNRKGKARTYLNLATVFLLCGLWHGAAWTFVVWGAWHGLGLVIERAGLGARLSRAPAWVGGVFTTAWVWAGWVFFRADDLSSAGAVFAALAGFGAHGAPVAGAAGWITPQLVLTLGVAWGVAWIPDSVVARAQRLLHASARVHAVARECAVMAGLVLCLAALASLSHNPFIYYRF